MEKQFDKKITWVIKNFSSLKSEEIYSDQFVVGGCKWRLNAYPKGYMVDNSLSMYLEVADYGTLPSGWRRHARYRLTVVNQNSEKHSQQKESRKWFEENSRSWGRQSMCPLTEIHGKDSGFLVNGELKIVVEIEVLEVIGKIDVTEETSIIIESMNVNGFQLLPSQAKSVSRIFERHPEIASEFRPKNAYLRTAYMSFLLGLIETMCQSPCELSKDDLSDAYVAFGSMTDAGFKLDWLLKKLDEVSEKKDKEQVAETRLQGMDEELKDMKQKCSEMEALLEKEKAEVLAAKASISFDDIV